MRILGHAWARYVLATPLFVSSVTYASILPPNNLHLQDDIHRKANITEADFHRIISSVLDQYESIVNEHGANLVRNNLWTDPTVNASAQEIGSDWIVNMYGGLARRNEVTQDGFALVVCHELGHHLAGYAFKGERWAANEGQADYFATQACARRIWKDDIAENAKAAATVNAVAKESCDEAWSTEDDRNLCYRISAASHSLAKLLAVLGGGDVPRFDTPDPSVVETTDDNHPAAQCRLDTYFSGSLCAVDFDAHLIPGKNHPEGQGSKAAELIASQVSCAKANGDRIGTRPTCWFAPKLSFLAMVRASMEMAEVNGNGNGIAEPGETVSLSYTLANQTDTATTGVSAVLVSDTAGVTTSNVPVNFADIKPGAQVTGDSPFMAGIGEDVMCGSEVKLHLDANSDRGNTSIEESIRLGEFFEHDMLVQNTPVEIPERGEVFSEMANPDAFTTTQAAVRVTLVHTYASDLYLSLVAPNGTEITLGRMDYDTSGSVLTKDFHVEFPPAAAAGTWKLKVEDRFQSDSGQLQNWSLTLGAYRCD